MHVAVGIGIVTNEAFAIGATAIPGPISEADWDGWMYHRFFDLHKGLADTTDGSSAIEFEVDSKAMRKWDGGAETLVGMVEAVEAGTASMDVFFDSRVLLKVF